MQYAELEPHYAAAERLIGTAGDAGADPFRRGARARTRCRPAPTCSVPPSPRRRPSASACTRTGPRVASTRCPYDDRPACRNCGFSAYYGCPIHAKGDPIASLQRALRTGRCEIRPESVVVDITTDPAGRRATGVRYLDGGRGPARGPRRSGGARRRRLRDTAAVAAERPGQLIGARRALPDVPLPDVLGGRVPLRAARRTGASRSPTSTTTSWCRVRPRPRRPRAAACPGSAAARSSTEEPTRRWRRRSSTRTGPEHNRSIRESVLRRRLWVLTMQGEDLPQPTNRIDLDPTGARRVGSTGGRVTYAPHAHELVASKHFAPLMEQVLREAGADWAFTPHLAARGQGQRAHPQPARRRPRLSARDGNVPDGHRPRHQRGRPRRAASTTSRTSSVPTRRCSRPRPATTRPSPSSPSPIGRPAGSLVSPRRNPASERPSGRFDRPIVHGPGPAVVAKVTTRPFHTPPQNVRCGHDGGVRFCWRQRHVRLWPSNRENVPCVTVWRLASSS